MEGSWAKIVDCLCGLFYHRIMPDAMLQTETFAGAPATLAMPAERQSYEREYKGI